jgi:hypothetical protein
MDSLGLGLSPAAPLSISSLMISLLVGVALAFALRWHFERFGSTLSNRSEFAQVFPLLILTTVLIITVVKSSLALSLGLVGALSIVRFRTPIKEPEELAYLFIAIATGLGLGADQIIPTVLAVSFILIIVGVQRWSRQGDQQRNLYLSVNFSPVDGSPRPMDALGEVVSRHTQNGDLRRVDAHDDTMEVTYFLDVTTPENISALVEDLQASFPGIGVTFIDQNQLPSV